jgi:phage major head subunit gpT-like protein
MTMVRGQYAQLLAPGVKANFVEFLDTAQREQQYDKVFNIDNTTKAFEDEVQYAGTPPMPEKTEAGAVAYTNLIPGGTKRYIPLAYALACRASWELIDDDQYGIIKQAPKALARSGRFTEEMVAWNVFNQGFSTTISTDGVSLFNNAHPLLGGTAATNVGPGVGNVISSGGTYPNRPATDMDLSYSALQLMSNQFQRMIDSQGLPIVVKPKKLLIPPELIFIARELLGSAGKPYTADNEVNALLGEDLSYMVVNFFTSQGAWFAVTEKEGHQLKFLRRKPLDTDFDDDFDTRSVKMMTFTRFAVGATHWLGTWGTNAP